MKEELKVVYKEWFSVWMLKKVQKRRGMDHFQYQALLDALKKEGDVMKEFVDKYKEVRLQVSRDKNISIQYASKSGEDVNNTLFMETNSLTRKRSQEARSRRESNTRRQDYRGWD